jgi:uncharacterized radical SAM protein YgiQ
MDFQPASALNNYPRYRADFSPSKFLPTSKNQMTQLGWNQCDIIIITGDAYVDHPGFGCAIIGRVLESHGFRVGIIPQPDWRNIDAFKALGPPKLFFGVTSGNMDSMVNHYTSERHVRDTDAYSPNGQAGLRPNRACIVYAQKCREAYTNVPIILGGIEAGLRRFAHYDFWSDKMRRSILFDAKADLLIYGNAERAIIHMSHYLGSGGDLSSEEFLYHTPGIAFICATIPDHCNIQDISQKSFSLNLQKTASVIQLNSFETIRDNPVRLSQTTLVVYRATRPGAPSIIQQHGNRWAWVNAPVQPLTTKEMDYIYGLPFSRLPHPMYGNRRIPAFEMIKDSITLMRGCFGGCSFCSITMHEGRIIQSRSEKSVIKEVKSLVKSKKFSGYISDLGGPTANMYQMSCLMPENQLKCKRLSCLFPTICKHLNTNHKPLIDLYQRVRHVEGVKGAWVASGIRYDLALKSPKYIETLVKYHVGGYLKVAPEHSESQCLKLMMKPDIKYYELFEQQFQEMSKKAGKKQFLIPYMLCAHPGTNKKDMIQLTHWLKKKKLKLDQVQIFLPTPLTLSTAMFVSGRHYSDHHKKIYVAKGGRARSHQKRILRYHASEKQ